MEGGCKGLQRCARVLWRSFKEQQPGSWAALGSAMSAPEGLLATLALTGLPHSYTPLFLHHSGHSELHVKLKSPWHDGSPQ